MLPYQALRGLTRSFSSVLPERRSQVHFTSLAVNGLPSCHLTPWRSGKRSSVPSSLHDQPVARSGTIDSMLFCATCWSKTTRLLKTPIIGRSAAGVDSSCSDMLAGLSKWESCRMPPAFWAIAGLITVNPSDSPTAAGKRCMARVISPSDARALRGVLPRLARSLVHRTIAWRASAGADDIGNAGSAQARLVSGPRPLSRGGTCRAGRFPCGRSRCRGGLLVQPQILEAPAIVDAVRHNGQALELRLPAIRHARIEQDRSGVVLHQLPFDLPHQPFAFLYVGFGRLLIHQRIDLGAAIAGVVAQRPADVILVKGRIGIVYCRFGDVESDFVVLAREPGIPLRGVEGLELAVDEDLSQLVNQDDRRVAIRCDVAG